MIIVFDKEQFILNLVSKILKKEKLEYYSTKILEEYLLNDINPKKIICDVYSLNDHEKELIKKFEVIDLKKPIDIKSLISRLHHLRP